MNVNAAIEFATLKQVDWFTNRRLPKPIGNIRLLKPRSATSLSLKSHSIITHVRPPANSTRFTETRPPRLPAAVPSPS